MCTWHSFRPETTHHGSLKVVLGVLCLWFRSSTSTMVCLTARIAGATTLYYIGRSQIEWKLKVKTQISVFP